MTSATTPTPAGREFLLSERDFHFLSEFVGTHTGIKLSDGKRELVYGRLARRLRQLGLGSFTEYCDLLRRDDGDELMQLVNAITTNLTSFFRERHHFDYLGRTVVPALLKANAATRRLRIWSAGCSTGAEPYSLAITLREALGDLRGWDVRILASDIDTHVLQTAAAGVYNDKDVSELPPALLRRWFLRGKEANAGRVRAKDALREMIDFRRVNLIEPWTVPGPFDAVFCRNVVIYFDKPTQKQLFDRFADAIVPQGHLFIGHSESLFKISDRFELIGQTIYRRIR